MFKQVWPLVTKPVQGSLESWFYMAYVPVPKCWEMRGGPSGVGGVGGGGGGGGLAYRVGKYNDPLGQ